MDINTLRILITLLAFGMFAGIVWWAYNPAHRERFERDARLVFDDTRGETEDTTHGDRK